MADIDIFGHVIYALRNATIKGWPFPHFYVENVFPDATYWEIVDFLSKKTDFAPSEGRYKGRAFSRIEDFEPLKFMQEREFLSEIAKIFHPWLEQRYAEQKLVAYHDTRLVRDGKGYFIGPHTDAAWKLISLLFYLPQDNWHGRHGTSLYLPKQRDGRCPGGPHHLFDKFDRIYTAPYITNSCFGFLKTDNSFHGVEPIEDDMRRDVLLYNVYDRGVFLQNHKNVGEQENGHP